MWQSRIEFEYYSIVYFKAHTHFVDVSDIHYIVHVSSTLSGSSVLWRVQLRNALEIRNGIIFDFYLGLPHIHVLVFHNSSKSDTVFPTGMGIEMKSLSPTHRRLTTTAFS